MALFRYQFRGISSLSDFLIIKEIFKNNYETYNNALLG